MSRTTDDPRDVHVSVRFTQSEARDVVDAKGQLSWSDYIRAAVAEKSRRFRKRS